MSAPRPEPEAPRKPRKPYVRWSEAVAARVCYGLARGISLRRLGERPDMPSPQQVRAWMRARPQFAANVRLARRIGGVDRPGRHDGYDPLIAEEVFQRLSRGEPLHHIARDPALPSLMTLYNWMRRRPRFARLVWLGRDLHLDRVDAAARRAIARLSEEDAAGEGGRAIRRSLARAAALAGRPGGPASGLD